nr:hypothetical protein [Actinoplanes deccanensis]
MTTRAPAATARSIATSASGTKTRTSAGVAGHPARRSKASRTVSPTLISACPMLPSSSGTRPSSTPPNTADTKSSRAPVSSVTIHGATVV